MKINKLIFILIMTIPLVNAQGTEEMLNTASMSRGMTLFFMCAAILITFPFINKQIKSIMMIPFINFDSCRWVPVTATGTQELLLEEPMRIFFLSVNYFPFFLPIRLAIIILSNNKNHYEES